MEKLLSIFSFEGFILEYPIPRDEVSSWLKNPDALSYPIVPDIPGPSYWDEFAVSILKECHENPSHDICIFSEIETQDLNLKKRIKFLLKTIGVDVNIIFVNTRAEDLVKFYKKNINFFLTKREKTKYNNVVSLLDN